MAFRTAVSCAWTDANYKAKLLSDPSAALAEAGVEVPAGSTATAVENTADNQHLVLPVAPAKADQLSFDELEAIAGGLLQFPE